MRHIRVDFGPHKNFYYLDKYSQLQKEIEQKYNITSSDYYVTSCGKAINVNSFNESLSPNFQIHLKMKGGFGGMPDFGGFFETIGNFFKGIGAVFKWLFVDFFKWLFMDFLNPYYILHDIVRGILSVLRVIILGVLDGVSGVMRSLVNLIFEPIVSSFWGYNPSEKEINPNDKSEAAKCSKGKKCFEQPDTNVAFPVIIATVILPPMGLFMELGLKGWMNLLLCAILTLFYYFPGLIYALIILYC
jgi:uncharacterized membrane protein YqaE (UPF0057 family)